jgi:hypothetical protein
MDQETQADAVADGVDFGIKILDSDEIISWDDIMLQPPLVSFSWMPQSPTRKLMLLTDLFPIVPQDNEFDDV